MEKDEPVGEPVVSWRLVAEVSDEKTRCFRYQLSLKSGYVFFRDYDHMLDESAEVAPYTPQDSQPNWGFGQRIASGIGIGEVPLAPRQRRIAEADLLESTMDVFEKRPQPSSRRTRPPKND